MDAPAPRITTGEPEWYLWAVDCQDRRRLYFWQDSLKRAVEDAILSGAEPIAARRATRHEQSAYEGRTDHE